MKLSLFRKTGPKAGKSYSWTPALELKDGWMICALNPFSSHG